MNMNRIIVSLVVWLLASGLASAGSTIDPNAPGQNSDLTSLTVRTNFLRAYNDINNILGGFAKSSPPASPTNLQTWVDTSTSPVYVFKYWNLQTGTWVAYATLNINTNAYSSVASSGSFLATPPVSVSVVAGVATYSLNIDSNFAVNGGNLALAPVASGHLLANCAGAPGEPGDCTWSALADRAIGSSDGMLPYRSGGAWTNISTGLSGHALPFLDGSANVWTNMQTVYPGSGSLAPAQAGTLIRAVNLDGVSTRIELDSYGSASRFSGLGANGTLAVPSALTLNTEFASFNGGGYNGTSLVNSVAAIRMIAAGTWSATNQSTFMDFLTTAEGDATKTLTSRMHIENNGGITIGPSALSQGAGTLNLAGDIFNAGVAPTGTGGYVRAIGPTITTSTGTVSFPSNISANFVGNIGSNISITNLTVGTSTASVFLSNSDTVAGSFGSVSSVYSNTPILAGRAFAYAVGAGGGGFVVGTSVNTAPVVFSTGDIERGRFVLGFMVGTATDPGIGIANILTGIRINNAATSGNVLRGNGTNFISAPLSCSDLSGVGTGCSGAAGITALTGDVTASGIGSVAATLATAQPAVHTWALSQTFTVAPVFTDQSGSRTALGLGTMATQNASAVAVTGGTIAGLTGLAVRDTSAAFDVTIAAISSGALSAGRTLTLNMGNVAHTLAFGTTANTITFPNLASYTVITNGDTGTVTNTMLQNSAVTVNGTSISLGASQTVTAAAGTLTGTTLNATVTASSLTSLGIIASLTNPLRIGGSAAGSTAEIRSTSGTGSGDSVFITGGTNGATRVATFLGTGLSGFGSASGAANPTNTTVVISRNATTVDAASSGLMPLLHLVGNTGEQTALVMDAYGTIPAINFRAAGGTAAAKAVVTTGSFLGAFLASGWDGTAYGVGAEILFKSGETFDATHHGSFASVFVVPSATTTAIESVRFQMSGGVTVGTGSIATDPGGGVVGAQNGFIVLTAAKTLTLKQGANGAVGTFVCNGVTPVTVTNTNVAITDAIIISLNTVGGTVGAAPDLKTITAATGFTAACTAADTSTYNYAIIKNAA